MDRSLLALVIAISSLVLLLLALTVTPHVSEVEGISQALTPDMVSSDFVTDSAVGTQNQTGLDYTAAITFTPVATIYLPVVLKNYEGCSPIPTLLSPSNASVLNNIAPLFGWNNGNDQRATQLRLQVARDSGFTQLALSLQSGTTTGVYQFRFPWNLAPATVYYWRAWLMCGGAQGPYSTVWSFTTGSGGTIPSAPALVSPANGSTVLTTTLTLQWSSLSGALDYLVYWRKSGQSGYTMRSVNNTQTTVRSLSANTTYDWWVAGIFSIDWG